MNTEDIKKWMEEKGFDNSALAIDSNHRVSLYLSDVLGEFEESRVKNLTIPVVKNWVAVKDSMPENCDQVFVKYENGKYGINEWWESDDCWKYQFDNMIVKEWCKPPCS